MSEENKPENSAHTLDKFKSPSITALAGEVLAKGFDPGAKARLIFRLNHIESVVEDRKKILKNGNLARLEPEIFVHLSTIQDLIDTVRELVTLIDYDLRQHSRKRGHHRSFEGEHR